MRRAGKRPPLAPLTPLRRAPNPNTSHSLLPGRLVFDLKRRQLQTYLARAAAAEALIVFRAPRERAPLRRRPVDKRRAQPQIKRVAQKRRATLLQTTFGGAAASSAANSAEQQCRRKRTGHLFVRSDFVVVSGGAAAANVCLLCEPNIVYFLRSNCALVFSLSSSNQPNRTTTVTDFFGLIVLPLLWRNIR